MLYPSEFRELSKAADELDVVVKNLDALAVLVRRVGKRIAGF
jgi:hypothetical protein